MDDLKFQLEYQHVEIVFNSHNITGWLNKSDYMYWINGDYTQVMRLKTLPTMKNEQEIEYKINARNIDFVRESPNA